jgi:hypothetical protein
MGYRSDVVYVFYTLKPDIIPFPLLKLWFDENFKKWTDMAEVDYGDDYIKVSYDSVKWYDTYQDVIGVREAVTIFTAAFDADNKDNAAWEMVEVGEDMHDIKNDGSGWRTFRLNVNREIHFD